ncbi:MAG: translational GTPase TypA [Gammaproteobacteria bacterium]|nr:translational GTPase TypA [Gammaproteobacteria bacterium]
MSNARPIRNIAIIAHVDHGKTTLVDCLLKQSGTFAAHERIGERVMDSNAIERERGITILAKNCAIEYRGTRINIVDTPGHADFGGEVERVLSMVDGVLLLVDAVEGPMPQTRFVTRKALALGLKAIVIVNKVDRPGARPNWVVDRTFELFDKLGATDTQLDFPIVYASALQGWATLDLENSEPNMHTLFDAVLAHIPPPPIEINAPLQLQISQLDYNSYVGRIGIGRILRGTLKSGKNVSLRWGNQDRGTGKIAQVLTFRGLERIQVDEAYAGDIVAVTGIDDINIGITICDIEAPQGLPPIKIDEPTLAMTFQVNTSPLAGREGKFVTSRQIRDRLMRELQSNVALRVDETADADIFRVSGRGELHLTILVENMRREGFELAVGKPQVLKRIVDGVMQEPFEALTIDIDEGLQGGVMSELGIRRGELLDMVIEGDPTGRGQGRVRLEYRVPARGLIGFQGEFMTMTRGTGLMSHIFDGYDVVKGDIPERHNGVLISNENGEAVAYSLFTLQERGRLFASHGSKVYEGMIIGIHSRENDLVVNPVKEKKLTNVRNQGKEDAVLLTTPIPITLEYAVEFINDDELVEVTPESIRLRKRFLKEADRKRASRN